MVLDAVVTRCITVGHTDPVHQKPARRTAVDWTALLSSRGSHCPPALVPVACLRPCQFASASMVALLASLTPMCLVVWKGVTGEDVHKLEIVGVLLALGGGVVSTVGGGGGDEGADPGAVGPLSV